MKRPIKTNLRGFLGINAQQPCHSRRQLRPNLDDWADLRLSNTELAKWGDFEIRARPVALTRVPPRNPQPFPLLQELLVRRSSFANLM
jgi:hypothetical protein